MFPKFLLLAIALFPLSLLATAETVRLNDVRGRSIEVEILGVSETLVGIKQNNDRIFDISLDRLAPDSRLLVELWAKQQEIQDRLDQKKIQFEASVEFTYDAPNGIQSKETGAFVTPTVKILNPNSNHEYKGLNGTLVVIGENNISKSILRVLTKQEFIIDLPSQQTSIWGGDSFIESYLKNKRSRGYKLAGYILLLENDKKEIVYAYGTSPLWILPIDKGLSLLEMADYDRTLSSYR